MTIYRTKRIKNHQICLSGMSNKHNESIYDGDFRQHTILMLILDRCILPWGYLNVAMLYLLSPSSCLSASSPMLLAESSCKYISQVNVTAPFWINTYKTHVWRHGGTQPCGCCQLGDSHMHVKCSCAKCTAVNGLLLYSHTSSDNNKSLDWSCFSQS